MRNSVARGSAVQSKRVMKICGARDQYETAYFCTIEDLRTPENVFDFHIV